MCEGEAYLAALKSGNRPCCCSNNRQTKAYINILSEGSTQIALKFGIANTVKRRVKEQNSYSIYDVVNCKTYQFLDKVACLAAERECKKVLFCGVVSKSDMPDGYTETTYLYNLDKIVEIYKKHGGVEIQ
ncbi:hypothetical protein D3C86_1891410 [compost metagenome]